NQNVRAFVTPASPVIPGTNFNICNYGAVGDGIATNTVAIQAAINAAGKAGGGTVELPAGVFGCGPVRLADPVALQAQLGATLRMLPLDKYPGGTRNPENFISGRRLHDVVITGQGTIDGQGIPWWPYARISGARRPRMIALSACDRVLIENVTL